MWWSHGMARNGRKSCFYSRSKSWESLIYHPMSPRDIPQHSVHGSRGRLKSWLIAFNFNRFRDSPGLVRSFPENFHMWYDMIYNASWVFRTIWIFPECHQTNHLLFCRAATEWPWNGRKSFSYSRSKPWESLLYHLMSPRGLPWHSVHRSCGRLKAWLIVFNFDRFRALPGPVIFSPKTFL